VCILVIDLGEKKLAFFLKKRLSSRKVEEETDLYWNK